MDLDTFIKSYHEAIFDTNSDQVLQVVRDAVERGISPEDVVFRIVLPAIRGEIEDRIPVFCNLLDQGARELGLSPQEYYFKGEYVAEAQLMMLRKYGYDNMWSLFYVGKEAELSGCRKIAFFPDGPPNVEDFVIRTLDDIETLEVPEDLSAHPAFFEGLACLEILRGEVGGKNPICAYITATMRSLSGKSRLIGKRGPTC